MVCGCFPYFSSTEGTHFVETLTSICVWQINLHMNFGHISHFCKTVHLLSYINYITISLCVDIVSYCNSPNHIALDQKQTAAAVVKVVNYWLVSSGKYKMKLRHFVIFGCLCMCLNWHIHTTLWNMLCTIQM